MFSLQKLSTVFKTTCSSFEKSIFLCTKSLLYILAKPEFAPSEYSVIELSDSLLNPKWFNNALLSTTFLHKVLPGSVDKSYGINVAKLADLPNNIIDRANELLVFYENKSNKKEKVIKQFTLDLDTKTDILREYIKTINPLEVTPMQAINILDEIKKKSEE